MLFFCPGPGTGVYIYAKSEDRLINFNSPSEIKQLLTSHNLAFRKRWGQNFLISSGVKEKLITILDLHASDDIWEIGSGIGSMTSLIAGKVQSLSLFEIDAGYVTILHSFFQCYEDIAVFEGDFLKTWKRCLGERGKPTKIFGNLPYSAGSIMLGRLMEERLMVDKMVFTLQKEVVERIIAVPGTRNYSSFSMLVQFMYNPTFHGTIAPGAFYPKPKVTSSIVELVPHNKYGQLKNPSLFFALVKDIFSSRRKTIRNNIRGGRLAAQFGEERVIAAFAEVGIDAGMRGEEVAVEKAVAVARKLAGT